MKLNALQFILIGVLKISVSFKYGEDEEGGHFVNEWAVQGVGGVSEMKALTRRLGLVFMRKIEGLDDIYVVRRPRKERGRQESTTRRLRRSSQVLWQEQQRTRSRPRRDLLFNDELYQKQWYLRSGGLYGHDMNVIKAWEMGLTGRGVVVSILDDGIARNHPELKENYDPKASYDFNDNDPDPSPRLDYAQTNRHGTKCAAIVAGVANNSRCGVGVAYRSLIGGMRILDGEVTDTIEASALTFHRDYVDIYSSAWGPDDNGRVIDGPGMLTLKALEAGARLGRNGLGSVFMWASGNGGRAGDSCACDGYASSVYTLSVSSVSESNRRPWYLEPCASTFASTYSSGGSNERMIVAASLMDRCTERHTGTSASVSLAAGIVALVLEANGNLTWRDVQYLTILAANTEPFLDAQWSVNGVGRKFSLLYGYGLMDAGKMVYLAPLWMPTPDQRSCGIDIKVDRSNVSSRHTFTFRVDPCTNATAGGVVTLEHVQLQLRINASRRGLLTVSLRSPSGTQSTLLPPRKRDSSRAPTPFDRWPLTSVQFWGEAAAGEWVLTVGSAGTTPRAVTVSMARLLLHGVAEERPVRLRPPADNPLPPNWFEREFRSLVVSDDEAYDEEEGPRGNETALQCHEECFLNGTANASSCSGPAAYDCHECRNFRIDASGHCVPVCPPRTFVNGSLRLCLPCFRLCEACNGPDGRNCSRCVAGSVFLPSQGRCLTSCPTGHFQDEATCQPCPAHCEVCESTKRCTSCRSDNGTWVLSPKDLCVRACPDRHYVSVDRQCKRCHWKCAACMSRSRDSCLACPAGQKLLKTNQTDPSGSCVHQCPIASFQRNGFCYRCHRSCESCSKHPNRCDSCVEPLIFQGGRCVDPTAVMCKSGTLMIQCLTRLVKSSLWMLHRLMFMLTGSHDMATVAVKPGGGT